MSALLVKGVHKSYGSTSVLEGIDLEIESGQVFAVLGASGSGKTTLLRAIAGFETIQKGSIAVGGKTVVDARTFVNPEKRGVAIVPQDQALFPHLTVAKNVGFGVHARDRRARVKEMLAFAGLESLAERMPHELSGGQQQRVALVRALAPSPSLVLLDEPFTGLDSSLRASIRENISTLLRSSGTTAVLVTHDQAEALSISDQVAVLRDGRVVQSGAPRDIYQTPIDVGVGSFVGDANVLSGQATNGRAVCVLGNLATISSVADGPIQIFVRPEQVTLEPGAEAEVMDRQYYGHDAMVILRMSTGELMRVRMHGDLPERGTQVGLRVQGPVLCFPS